MAVLLTYMVLIEPDLQQLSKFVLESAEKLGANQFKASTALIGLLEELRKASRGGDSALETQLVIRDKRLELSWNGERHLVVQLESDPASVVINALGRQLKYESELADPELLRVRNEKISLNLENAKKKAAEEMAELEADLASKKRKLWVASHQAETDSLTGLLNRGAYDARLKAAIKSCQKEKLPLCLMLLDLDNFKEINDSQGHQYGDKYLKNIASVMRGSCRHQIDYACRIGGDEFAIIMFAEIQAGYRIAEKILIEFAYKVSIGIVKMNASDDVEKLVSRCDNALYEAKEEGRGQIIAA